MYLFADTDVSQRRVLWSFLYDSLPHEWSVSEVAKVCAVRNTPEHEFALCPCESFAFALPSGRSAVARLTTPRSSQSSLSSSGRTSS